MRTDGLLLVALATTVTSALCPMGRQFLDSYNAPESALKRRQVEEPPPTFNAELQRINVKGEHAFIPPGAGDHRGSCPGLNAMANHGYIPRSGYVELEQSALACNQVYGLPLGTCRQLAVSSVVLAGDPLTQKYSIGGPPSLPQGVVGNGQGLSKSHNRFESDASATRGDSYLHQGDVDSTRVEKFKALYDLAKMDPVPNYTIDVVAKHRKYSFDLSEETNPYFFFAPFSGLVTANVGHALIPALFSNHSEEYPAGILGTETLKSFFAMTEKNNGELSHTRGHERIPDVWYRRADEYDGDEPGNDLMKIFNAAPESMSVGGNTGTVNSYQGVDISDLTGGAFRTQDLLDPRKITCFMYQLTSAAIPDFVRAEMVGTVLEAALELFNETMAPYLDPNCVQIVTYDEAPLEKFPGKKQKK